MWVDAHADINNFNTSPSLNVHGMPVSFLARLIECVEVGVDAWLCVCCVDVALN